MIKKLESAGLGFHVRDTETKEMLGMIFTIHDPIFGSLNKAL